MVMVYPLAFNSTGCVEIMNEPNLFFNLNIIGPKHEGCSKSIRRDFFRRN
jgi:hypothetical protein